MKQHITEEQWEELAEDQQRAFSSPDGRDISYGYITIGQMIEFLGDEWWQSEGIGNEYDNYDQEENVCGTTFTLVENNNLCDALWEAVKHKLNQ